MPSPLAAMNDSGSFGGNQALVVDDIQDRRLYQLCFHNGSNNLYKGLSWEDYGAFWNGIDITGEMEILQVIQKILLKDAKASQDKQCLP